MQDLHHQWQGGQDDTIDRPTGRILVDWRWARAMVIVRPDWTWTGFD